MQTALAAGGLRIIRLVELSLSQGTYRYAFAPVDVSFGGSTYTATSGAVSDAEESADGSAPQFRIVLQNVDGVIGALVDGLLTGADARGKRVTVRTVEESQIADSSAVITDTYLISDYRLTREAVILSVGSPMAAAVLVPHRILGSTRCPWVYKGPECGSQSTEKTCGKTLSDCRARFPADAFLRFGGYIGRSKSRRSFFV